MRSRKGGERWMVMRERERRLTLSGPQYQRLEVVAGCQMRWLEMAIKGWGWQSKVGGGNERQRSRLRH